MNRLISFAEKIRPLKVLAVVFLSLSLMFSQTFSAFAATTKANPGEKSEYYVSKDGNALNSYEGGMNNFSDVDARASKAENEAKADAKVLKRQAEKNVKNQSSNIGENIRRVANDSDKLGKNIQNRAESIKDKFGEETDNFADSTKQGLRNIKDNATDAADYAGEIGDRTVGNPLEGIKQGTKNTADSVKRTLRDAD
jgi:DNA anti-recombination protein RmuC